MQRKSIKQLKREIMKELSEIEARDFFGGRKIYIIHENGTFEIINVPD